VATPLSDCIVPVLAPPSSLTSKNKQDTDDQMQKMANSKRKNVAVTIRLTSQTLFLRRLFTRQATVDLSAVSFSIRPHMNVNNYSEVLKPPTRHDCISHVLVAVASPHGSEGTSSTAPGARWRTAAY